MNSKPFLSFKYISEKLKLYPSTKIEKTPEGFRKAAVLLPLAEIEGEIHVVLTRRTHEVKTHKGQVAFPGGMKDDSDITLEQTALRETQEEIEINPDEITLLGQLNDRLTISDFLVRPFVGLITSFSAETLNLKNREIERVFTVPLEWFANPEKVRIEYWERQKFIRTMHFWRYDNEIIWGMSAEIIAEFVELLFGKDTFKQVPVSPTTMNEFLAVLNSQR